jgi:hypothetical protein
MKGPGTSRIFFVTWDKTRSATKKSTVDHSFHTHFCSDGFGDEIRFGTRVAEGHFGHTPQGYEGEYERRFFSFNSRRDHRFFAAAPRERSGGASGMLGTARLLGQTIGAVLVALLLSGGWPPGSDLRTMVHSPSIGV